MEKRKGKKGRDHVDEEKFTFSSAERRGKFCSKIKNLNSTTGAICQFEHN